MKLCPVKAQHNGHGKCKMHSLRRGERELDQMLVVQSGQGTQTDRWCWKYMFIFKWFQMTGLGCIKGQ